MIEDLRVGVRNLVETLATSDVELTVVGLLAAVAQGAPGGTSGSAAAGTLERRSLFT